MIILEYFNSYGTYYKTSYNTEFTLHNKAKPWKLINHIQIIKVQMQYNRQTDIDI